MTTIVTKTIGSTGDYTTLQSWEDACPADLTAVDQIWRGQCLKEVLSATSNPLAISGPVTDNARRIELTTATGASFRDDPNVLNNALRYDNTKGAAIEVTGSYGGTAITCSVDFTRFSNLQIGAVGSHTAALNVSLAGSGTATCDIDACIIQGSFAINPTAAPLKMYGANQMVRNSLIVQRGASQPCIAIVQNGAKADNCTFAVPSDIARATVALVGAYAAPTHVNNVFAGVVDIWSGGTAPSFTTCYTDASNGGTTGVTLVAYSDFHFVSTTDATRDFRIQSTSVLRDSGTSNANSTISIGGNLRGNFGTNYDVGAWEYQAPAATAAFSRGRAVNRGRPGNSLSRGTLVN